MEMLSGLLLVCVVLAIIGFLLREVMGEGAGAAFRKYAQASPEELDDPLVGEVGQVVEYKEGAELMKVRIRGERWSANLVDGQGLVAGTEVKVTAVNGLVLDVEPCVDEPATPPDGAPLEET